MLSQGEEDNAGRRKKTQQDDHGFSLGGLLDITLSAFLVEALENNKILSSTAKQLSGLDELQQIWIRQLVAELGYYPTLRQAKYLNELQLSKKLTKTRMREVFIQVKLKQRKIEFRYYELEKYFSPGDTVLEMRQQILNILENRNNIRR